jgi:branched-chain amino acid transport system substrate-binding protein
VLVSLANTGKLNDTLQAIKANNKRLPLLGGEDLYTLKTLKDGRADATD